MQDGMPGVFCDRPVPDRMKGKVYKGLCKVKKIPKIIWKWVGGSRSHFDNNKKLENRPKIKFCVCTIRPCLTVHVAARDVHACSILSRIL